MNDGYGLHQDCTGQVGQTKVAQHQVEHSHSGLVLLKAIDNNEVDYNAAKRQ